MSHPAEPPAGGGRPPRLLWLAGGVVTVGLLAHLAIALRRHSLQAGDFDLCREFGRRFLAGEPLYAGGLHYPYPPAAALYFAPLALLPPAAAFVLRYLIALAALGLSLRWLAARGAEPAARAWRSAALTVVLGAHYVVRDLDDAGGHLILLSLAVLGFRLAREGRATAAGACLGLAAAVKAPLALVLGYVAWKGDRRTASSLLAWIVLWTLLPAVWMGPAAWLAHERRWVGAALGSALSQPSLGAEESERRPQNQSLRRVVERNTELDLGPNAARAAGDAASMVLLAWLMVWTGAAASRTTPDRARLEEGAVLVVATLLSPVTWVQHLVLAVPALHAIAVELVPPRRDRGIAVMTLVYAALALVLNREILGRAAYVELLASGMHSAAMLLLLAALVRVARLRAEDGNRGG